MFFSLALVCVLVAHPKSTEAKKPIILSDLEFVEFKGTIMSVHAFQGYMIVSEKKVFVAFDIGTRSYRSQLTSKHQSNLKLLSFRNGNTVVVKGVKFPDGVIAAAEIQNLSVY